MQTIFLRLYKFCWIEQCDKVEGFRYKNAGGEEQKLQSQAKNKQRKQSQVNEFVLF